MKSVSAMRRTTDVIDDCVMGDIERLRYISALIPICTHIVAEARGWCRTNDGICACHGLGKQMQCRHGCVRRQ